MDSGASFVITWADEEPMRGWNPMKLPRTMLPYIRLLPGHMAKMNINKKAITGVEYIDQNPIGKSTRSNPVTYLKAWDDIRKIFSDTQAAKVQGFKPAHFSFNVPGGRCEECQGEGIIKVEMQFMQDVFLQ